MLKNFLKNNCVSLVLLVFVIIAIGLLIFNIKLTCFVFHDLQHTKIVERQFNDVVRAYDEYKLINKFDNYSYYMLGKSYYKNREFNKAIENFEKYKKTAKPKLSLYLVLGDSYSGLGYDAKSVELFEEGLKYFPNNYALINAKAYSKYLLGENLQSVLEEVNASIAIKPTSSSLHSRAEIERKLGQYELAISDCDAALKMNHETYYCNCERAMSLVELGRIDEAYEDIKLCEKDYLEKNDDKYKFFTDKYLHNINAE